MRITDEISDSRQLAHTCDNECGSSPCEAILQQPRESGVTVRDEPTTTSTATH